MSHPEQMMWQQLRPSLAGLDPVRIESLVTLGNPDVNITTGWIELKFLNAWPKRETTKVRIDHFTPEQRAWAIRRTKAGGKVWLLLRVGFADAEWLLLNGAVAAVCIGELHRAGIYGVAQARWNRLPTNEEMVRCLS